MSDALKNNEIENVLSSIRRLVAEDPKVAASKNAPAERLLLSDTQRISEVKSVEDVEVTSDSVSEPAQEKTVERPKLEVVDFSDHKPVAEVKTDTPKIAPEQPFSAKKPETVVEDDLDDAILENDDDENIDIFASDDGGFDEDALRDLVAELVRQELQGELGERITRNVRKLVRREIHRALASQELN
ncbi:hypothetical protein [Pseudaestuariivita rosea]|uniref:hypothetical protein n=1 Tax=Pseudaestuariivita rosea TaxID=2763263 RepID=UPI001ABA0F58|nr:hypothetical protein [Pseudaestuariivita rosea]